MVHFPATAMLVDPPVVDSWDSPNQTSCVPLYWLFHRNPYNVSLLSLYNWAVESPQIPGFQPRGPFFMAHLSSAMNGSGRSSWWPRSAAEIKWLLELVLTGWNGSTSHVLSKKKHPHGFPENVLVSHRHSESSGGFWRWIEVFLKRCFDEKYVPRQGRCGSNAPFKRCQFKSWKILWEKSVTKTSWWFQQTPWKICERQIGSFPQGFGVKIQRSI